MNIDEGFVPGRSKETARKLLAAADKAHVDQRLVRAVEGGYVAPAKVLDAYTGASNKTSSRKRGKRPTNKKGD